MGDKEALTAQEKANDEETERNMEMPPGFIEMDLKSSVIYKGQQEKPKELAKAAMARRTISVDNNVPETESKAQKPVAEDSKAKIAKTQSLENIQENTPSDQHPAPDYDTAENATAENPLLSPSAERDVTAEEADEGNITLCCLTIKTKPSIKPDWPPRFQIKDIILAFIGFLTFAIDYGTDIRLLIYYYTEQRWSHLYLTAGFIVVPSVISGIISMIWYKMYYRRDKRNKYDHARTLYLFRIALSFLQLGRLWRQAEYIYNASHSIRLERKPGNSEEAQRLRKRATEEKRDATILGLIDGFLESALQLILQIFIAADNQYYITDFPILSSLLASWVSTSLIITTYYRANRKAQKDKENVDYVSSFFYLLWRMFELGPRYILLGLCAAYFKPWVFIVAVPHVIFVVLLYRFMKAELAGICDDPSEEKTAKVNEASSAENGDVNAKETETENGDATARENKTENKTDDQQARSKGCGVPVLQHAFLVVLGFIGLFSFINLKEGQTRYLTFIYYVVYYAENLLMVALLVWLADDRLPPPDCYVLVVAPIGIVGHVISAGLFYMCFHPKTAGTRRIIAPRVKINCPILRK